MAPGRSTDAQSGGVTNSVESPSTHNPFGNIWHKVTDVAHTAKDGIVKGAHIANEKIHQEANDPANQAKLKQGERIAGHIGTGVVNNLKQEGAQTAAAAKRGDYVGVAEHVAPLALGGGIPAVAAKVILPSVMKEGMKELPAGTRHNIESSGAGRLLQGAAEHGGIPTSPTDVARMGIKMARDNAVQAALHPEAHPGTGAGNGGEKGKPANAAGTEVKPNVVKAANSVFPSWMHGGATPPPEKPKQ